jgi:hypothetical protein
MTALEEKVVVTVITGLVFCFHRGTPQQSSMYPFSRYDVNTLIHVLRTAMYLVDKASLRHVKVSDDPNCNSGLISS